MNCSCTKLLNILCPIWLSPNHFCFSMVNLKTVSMYVYLNTWMKFILSLTWGKKKLVFVSGDKVFLQSITNQDTAQNKGIDSHPFVFSLAAVGNLLYKNECRWMENQQQAMWVKMISFDCSKNYELDPWLCWVKCFCGHVGLGSCNYTVWPLC